MAKCNNPKCGVSTFIDEETLTFGSGHLDEYGVWEHGCKDCAEDYLESHPGAWVMWADSTIAEYEMKRNAEFDKECDWAPRQVNPHIFDDVDDDEDY